MNTAIIFVMFGNRICQYYYFDLAKFAAAQLRGEYTDWLSDMRNVCRPPYDQYHGPYLIKEISHHNGEWETLRRYVNTLTPEQLKELKI